jgi:hypothetical protein
MTLEDNVNSRRDAEEVMDLIGDRTKHFWECLASMAQAKAGIQATPIGQPKETLALSDEDARLFSKTPWSLSGFSNGLMLRDVDPEYVCRIADGNDFTQKLRRYVRSKYFKELQRRVEDSRPDIPPHLTRVIRD